MPQFCRRYASSKSAKTLPKEQARGSEQPIEKEKKGVYAPYLRISFGVVFVGAMIYSMVYISATSTLILPFPANESVAHTTGREARAAYNCGAR